MQRRKNVISLSGTWQCMIDPKGEGSVLGYHARRLSAENWRTAELPLGFEYIYPEFPGYQGAMWFRKDFSPMQKSGLVWLSFLCANYRTDVWVNGSFVGSHTGGFLPFRFEISKYLSDSETNTVSVRVDNRVLPGQIPTAHGWLRSGGLLRDIRLCSTPDVYLENVFVKYEGKHIAIRAEVNNAGGEERKGQIFFSVEKTEDTLFKRTVFLPGKTVLDFSLSSDKYALWSPEHPNLYRLFCTLTAGGETDEAETSFGLRSVEARDEKILLNGTPLLLKGFNRHEDSPERGMATDIPCAKKDYETMKAMGANFIRLCHYPHSEEELELCDALGLCVLCEVPLNALGLGEMGADTTHRRLLPEVFLNAKRMAKEMILRDYNHPCILFWCASNETNELDGDVREINRGLVSYLKKTDPTRLAVHVSMGGFWNGRRGVTAPLFEEDDAVCLNSYSTMEIRENTHGGCDPEAVRHFWDSQKPRLQALYPGKPIIITEFGFPAGRTYDGARDEQAQAEAIYCDLSVLSDEKYGLAGYAVWAFADHPWELLPDGIPVFHAMTSPYGVFTRDRLEKPAAKVIREYYKKTEKDGTDNG